MLRSGKRRPNSIAFLLVISVILSIGTKPRAAELARLQASAAQSEMKEPAEFKHLRYRSIGPARGGRVDRAAGVPGDSFTYYAATASGGLWKSTDGGTSWKPIFDDQPVSTIGSIGVSPSDPNVIYAGTGEANIRGNVQTGNGIYKSVDAGKTWRHVWEREGQIGTMIVHPTNPDIAFAAVLGHAFGPNPERGVYRTLDGGKTWEQVLKKDADTGASDICFDPSNPNILFAGLWQARRRPWELTSGGPGSGLYVSRDGGNSWKQLTGNGLPEGVWGKVGVAVAPSDGQRVYALIEAENGGLFRSDDGGENWKLATGNHALRQRAWYYSTLTVDPSNSNTVWFPQVSMLRTIDGGMTIEYVKGFYHGDHHDLWIDPRNPKRMISANDGGVDISTDGGKTWFAPPLPIGQFYHISADTRVPYQVAGALQDLSTAQGPSNSLVQTGIRLCDWHDVGGGEAGWVVSDPANPNIVYAGEYGGYITRYDYRIRQALNVSIYPDNPSGHGAADMKYRFQWTAPIATSPHDPGVVYHGGNVLFKTSDEGQTWTAVSPDLTRDDKSKEQWSGGPITGDNTGAETYCTIFAVAESPKQKDLIWVGSDDGLVHITQDGGKTWNNVTSGMPGMPQWGTVSLIEPSPFDAATAYVVVDAHRLDDMRPYLYVTTDYGQTWRRLDSGLPQDVYLHAVREDPAQRGLLYLGTERGVMFSPDGGSTWTPLRLNLPAVAVHDLVVKDNDLVLGTHGRSCWIFDDLTPIRAWSSKIAGSEIYLFPTQSAIRWRYESAPDDKDALPNPPEGATINYFLKEKPKGDVTIEITDAQGKLVKTLSSKPRPFYGDADVDDAEARKKAALPAEVGVNRGVWDLRYEGAEMIVGAKLDEGNPAAGPMVLPGTYTLKLSADGRTAASSVKVAMDPRVHIPEADLQAHLKFALAVRDEITLLTRTVDQIRFVRRQLRERIPTLKSNPKAAELIKSSDELIGKLNDLDGRLQNPKAQIVYDILAQKGGAKLYSRLSPLLDYVTKADGAPTEGMKNVLAEESKEMERYAAELQTLISTDLAAINSAARKLEIPYVIDTRPR